MFYIHTDIAVSPDRPVYWLPRTNPQLPVLAAAGLDRAGIEAALGA